MSISIGAYMFNPGKPPNRPTTDRLYHQCLLNPAAGYRNNSNGQLYNVGSNGNYWSSSANSDTNGYNLNFNSSNLNPANNNNRQNGNSVRCVKY
jgi:uncharacterized protein (TIGR02145 family)